MEVSDLGGAFLAIAVDTSISLLEGHEGPGDIEVDQFITEVMEIKAFGGDI